MTAARREPAGTTENASAARQLQAVLFDLDGTLIDSEPAWMGAEARLAADFGISWTQADSESLVGVDLRDAAAIFMTRGVPLTAEEIVDRLVGEVLESLTTELPERPGALALIDRLTAAGVPLALVTMSTRPIVDRVEQLLSEKLGRSPFAATVSGDDCLKGKPDPEPYLRGLQLLGAEASASVAIEDSFTGARSALAAGLATVGVPHAVDVSQLDGIIHWPSLEGRGVRDMQDALEGVAK